MPHLSELIQQKQGSLSNRELARQSNLSEGEIRRIKLGSTAPKLETLEKLARTLRISLQELLDAKDKERGITRRQFLELTAVTAAAGLVGVSDQPQKQAGDYEAQARMASAAGNWPKAEALWILAAGVADQEGNVSKWADAILQASQMATNLSKFDNVKGVLETIIRKLEVSAPAKGEALIRLGWAYFEEEKYSQAQAFLSHGVRYAEALLSERKDDPYLENLRGIACHFLGRTLTAFGEQTNNKDALENALHNLHQAYRLDKKYRVNPGGLYPRPHPLYRKAFTAMGFDSLRHVPIFLHLHDRSQANNSLAEATEYLTESGIMGGHINYHRALLRMEGLLGQPGQRSPNPQELLDEAARGFIDPLFYPKGLADVYLTKGNWLQDSSYRTRSVNIHELKRAFEYALVASILHPYERNLGEIQVMAARLYNRLQKQQFLTFTRDLTDQVRTMDREPFSALKHYDPTRSIWVVEQGLTKIDKAIKREFKWPEWSKEPLFPPKADNLFDLLPI